MKDKKLIFLIVPAAILIFMASIALRAVILVVGLASAPKNELLYMVRIDNREYDIIAWDGRQYIPYCAISKGSCGKQIGVVYGDEKDKVYEYGEYPAEEWIINAHTMDGGAMLYREISVTEIPEGLESEYEWNN